MRSYFRGLLGGVVGTLLVLALVGGGYFLYTRERSSPEARRARLLRQIDEYERWRQASPDPERRARVCLETGYGRNDPWETFDPVGCQEYMAALQGFSTQHPEFGAYFIWWREAVYKANVNASNARYHVVQADPASLRHPYWLELYVGTPGDCPADRPVKGRVVDNPGEQTIRVYYVPADFLYPRVAPAECFADGASAGRAGYYYFPGR